MIAGYVRIAKQDLDGARSLNRNAAYLCEQAAEKLIRAVLTAEIDAALTEIVAKFQVDLSVSEGPAGKPEPIR